MSQYVQHISGQGEKWRVIDTPQDDDFYEVYRKSEFNLRLPKSEYRLCEPPERWEDVTAECEVHSQHDWPRIMHRLDSGCADVRQKGYRITKKEFVVEGKTYEGGLGTAVSLHCVTAFIIEKKVQP